MKSISMRLINIEAFMKREELMDKAWRAVTDHQTDVLKFCDETTKYAILSHRWDDPTEISYEEMVDLGKIGRAKRNKIRQRRGYTKILKTCMQAKKDGYSWVWIDTCCIDKRSSAELSEAINSMYRWYENSSVCYAYLHDVDGSFPTKKDDQEYKLNGWPEWFSRGWTLQEMVASRNVRFFDKNWKFIGDKKEHAKMLQDITQVPQRILVDGLSGNRPCVAQIISWAANRRTTRIEDKAYSLMGLLDVNMPMLYGEGKKAFHRLQLEIIRSSDDQSIFAWCNEAKMRPGSILAEDPSFFKHCSEMELMGYDEFIKALKENIRDLPSIDRNHLGTFPITNRGIQIWMLLRPYRNSDTDFQAWLPCRNHQSASPATINLALRNYNYYRYPCSMHGSPTEDALQFSQVFLRYQDAPSDNVTFEIDDSALADNDFTCCDLHPEELKGNTLTLTGATPLCARVYSNSQGDLRFTVTFRQFFSQGWVHATSDPTGKLSEYCNQESVKGPESMQSMAEVPSRGERYGRIWVNHVRLHSTWIVRVSRVVWERNRIGVRVDAFKDTDFNIGLDKWRILDVEVCGSFVVYIYSNYL